MKLQSFRRIIKSDYSADEQSLVDKLSSSINIAFDNVFEALNGKIDLTNNVSCTVTSVNVMTNSSGVPAVTTAFKISSANVKVIGCSVISAINNTNTTTYPTSSPFIIFSQNNDVITINNISGLVADNNYTLKIIAWYG